MTVTLDDVYDHLHKRIRSAFNGVSLSKQGNHIALTSKNNSGQEVQTKINFHPEVVKNDKPTQRKQVSDNVFIYPSNHFARPCIGKH